MHGCSDQVEGKSSRHFAVLPYMKGVTERLQRAFKKHDTRLYSKAGFTVRNAVVSAPRNLLARVNSVVSSMSAVVRCVGAGGICG